MIGSITNRQITIAVIIAAAALFVVCAMIVYPHIVSYRARIKAIEIAENSVDFEVATVVKAELAPGARGVYWNIELEGKPVPLDTKDTEGQLLFDHRGAAVVVNVRTGATKVWYCE